MKIILDTVNAVRLKLQLCEMVDPDLSEETIAKYCTLCVNGKEVSYYDLFHDQRVTTAWKTDQSPAFVVIQTRLPADPIGESTEPYVFLRTVYYLKSPIPPGYMGEYLEIDVAELIPRRSLPNKILLGLAEILCARNGRLTVQFFGSCLSDEREVGVFINRVEPIKGEVSNESWAEVVAARKFAKSLGSVNSILSGFKKVLQQDPCYSAWVIPKYGYEMLKGTPHPACDFFDTWSTAIGVGKIDPFRPTL